MSAEENKALFRSFVSAWNVGDTAAMFRFWAPDMTHHDRARDCGPADVYILMASFMAAFPDLTFEIEQLIAEKDIVAARMTARATQQGDFMGRPADGHPIKVTVMGQVRIVDGRIKEHWNLMDEVHLMQQLGLAAGTFFDAVPS
jgi:C-1 hydroxylase